MLMVTFTKQTVRPICQFYLFEVRYIEKHISRVYDEIINNNYEGKNYVVILNVYKILIKYI